MAKFLQRIEYVPIILGLFGIQPDHYSLVPTLLSTLAIFIIGFFEDDEPHHEDFIEPNTGPIGMLAYGVFTMLLSLPSVIITHR